MYSISFSYKKKIENNNLSEFFLNNLKETINSKIKLQKWFINKEKTILCIKFPYQIPFIEKGNEVFLFKNGIKDLAIEMVLLGDNFVKFKIKYNILKEMLIYLIVFSAWVPIVYLLNGFPKTFDIILDILFGMFLYWIFPFYGICIISQYSMITGTIDKLINKIETEKALKK